MHLFVLVSGIEGVGRCFEALCHWVGLGVPVSGAGYMTTLFSFSKIIVSARSRCDVF